ncbi:atrial natriuretic peptide-converting enzyme-like protein [Lates japonicus]|uniref:Atrial natriuretic peptide-converting enzyme-like protein n=1 Tax=Lates japonicus TaxID=270547 RepID=A0AAD3NDW9_LATJO|nr:atrial natriuretic peptide-converting enzyme-like protein [Lates japonicus]
MVSRSAAGGNRLCCPRGRDLPACLSAEQELRHIHLETLRGQKHRVTPIPPHAYPHPSLCKITQARGSSLKSSSPTPGPIARGDPGYHSNSTNPSLPHREAGSVRGLAESHSKGGHDGVTYLSPGTRATRLPALLSGHAHTRPTAPPDWLASVALAEHRLADQAPPGTWHRCRQHRGLSCRKQQGS